MVVDADSAKIGDGYEEAGSIPANHSQMTKFESSEAIGFKRVVACLRRWVQELRVDEHISPADISDCMATLNISETKHRVTNVRKAYKATFHWLFDPTIVSFSEWLRASVDHPSPIYWIQGKPGSGKSTLMNFAMKDRRTLGFLGGTPNTDSQWTSVAFFFHERGSSIQKSLVGMLREIFDSILHQIPQLIHHAVTVYKDLVRAQRTRAPNWHLEALNIFGQPDHYATSSLPGPPQLLEPECLVYLTEQITTKAQGVFIWVRLVVDQLVKSIRDGTPYKTLRRMIAETPEELQDLYDNTLCRIDPGYANETYVMFQLVLCSIEPLPLDTVVKATEMSLDRYLNDNNNQRTNASGKVSDNLSTEGLLRWLISRGGGLLEAYPAGAQADHLCESGTSHLYVQFLHQTTKEYIQSPRAYDLMKRVASQLTNKNGFYFLTLSSQSCSAWVAPIKVHMLHYAKLVEVDNRIDARLEILIFPAQGPEDDHCGFDWWLE
ncbi:MAG: hypothetical protein Q9186_005235 [Xanthomendoza sp. 1 TL-2023]